MFGWTFSEGCLESLGLSFSFLHRLKFPVLLEIGRTGFRGVFAVTRAAGRRDRSVVASAGCQLIPWDGTAGTVMQGGLGIRVSCGSLLPLPREGDAVQVGFFSFCIPWALPCCG